MIARNLKWTAGGAWLALTGLWLLFVAQRPAPAALSLAVAILAFAATLGLLAERAAAKWRRGDRARLLALAALVLLALALYLPGIRHEVGDNYYLDEGAYRKNADAINEGHFLRHAFHYPHLIFYVDAFATWMATLFHPAILSLSDALYGIADWRVFCRLLARAVTALAGALTVVPAFFLGARLGGLGAGVASGLLTIAAREYHEGANLAICDVPSAFFAMCCLAATGRLLRQERARDYLLAGVWAGLAAGSKYPAGVVAVAILAVYVRGRIRDRRWSWGLFAAGGGALATFLLTTPGMVVFYPRSVFGDRGALYGYRQYSGARWIGAVADSNLGYYLDLIAISFGWLTLAAGLAGLLLLGKRARADVAWLLPFPLLYLGLITSMSIVAERNLYPALPPLATLLGVGVRSLARAVAERLERPRVRRRAAAALTAAIIAAPLWRLTQQEIGYRRDSTRQIASVWIYHNLPHGSRILKERYTPNVNRRAFEVNKTRWIGSYSIDELEAAGVDYVVLSHRAYRRFLDPENHFEPHHALAERNYRAIFDRLELVGSFEPAPTRRGPTIRIYRVGDEGS